MGVTLPRHHRVSVRMFLLESLRSSVGTTVSERYGLWALPLARCGDGHFESPNAK
jgi:hypothetical protein